MSRRISYNCDICQCEIPRSTRNNESALIRLFPPGSNKQTGYQTFELCNVCYEKFIDFLENGGRTDE